MEDKETVCCSFAYFDTQTGGAISWEQRKLGEIADHVIEKNLSLVEHETFTNSAEFGIVSQMDFFDHGITNEENIGNYYIVHPEDFVYNPRISVTAPVGPINRNKLGRNGVMSPLYTVFRPHDIDNTYLEYYFKADGWHSFMRFNGDTGARSDRFSIKTELFYEMPILIPKLEEQNAIGRFLRNLSEHIALHQRKCFSLKILCRYEIFITWEQRKLGEVFQEYSEKNHEELPALTIVQGKGTVPRDESNRNLQYDKSSLSNYKMVKKDDFIVHLRSFEGGLEKANSNGIISPAYHTFHGDDTDARFYYPFFRSENFIECLLKPHVYGIRDGKSIDIEGMKTIDIPVPSFAEQQKIGGDLEQVDRLIALHQRKANPLKILVYRSDFFDSF